MSPQRPRSGSSETSHSDSHGSSKVTMLRPRAPVPNVPAEAIPEQVQADHEAGIEHAPDASAALDYHALPRAGKIAVVPTKPMRNQRDLSLAYTPGVAEPCRE